MKTTTLYRSDFIGEGITSFDCVLKALDIPLNAKITSITCQVTTSEVDRLELCECEGGGHFCSGLPGVLAHIVGGRVESDVERCDFCERYNSDEEAQAALEVYLEGRIP